MFCTAFVNSSSASSRTTISVSGIFCQCSVQQGHPSELHQISESHLHHQTIEHASSLPMPKWWKSLVIVFGRFVAVRLKIWSATCMEMVNIVPIIIFIRTQATLSRRYHQAGLKAPSPSLSLGALPCHTVADVAIYAFPSVFLANM